MPSLMANSAVAWAAWAWECNVGTQAASLHTTLAEADEQKAASLTL